MYPSGDVQYSFWLKFPGGKVFFLYKNRAGMKIIDTRAYYGIDNICAYIVYISYTQEQVRTDWKQLSAYDSGNCHLICTAPEGRKQLFTDSKTAGGHLKVEWDLLNGG